MRARTGSGSAAERIGELRAKMNGGRAPPPAPQVSPRCGLRGFVRVWHGLWATLGRAQLAERARHPAVLSRGAFWRRGSAL